jgi:hypothetical protein
MRRMRFAKPHAAALLSVRLFSCPMWVRLATLRRYFDRVWLVPFVNWLIFRTVRQVVK